MAGARCSLIRIRFTKPMALYQVQRASWKTLPNLNKLNKLHKYVFPGASITLRRTLAITTRAVDDNVKRVSGVNLCPKECLCSRNDVEITYKNVRLLSQFVSSQTGMILPRTITKVCMKKQKEIGKAIKLARAIGFMPETYKAVEYLGDPKLFK